MNKICFIVNPFSGTRIGTHDIVRLIEDIVTPDGREYEIAYIKGPGDGARLSREAIAQGIELVAAVGGDGTVNEVGQGESRHHCGAGNNPRRFGKRVCTHPGHTT